MSPEVDAQWFHPSCRAVHAGSLYLCPFPLDFSEPHVASQQLDSELEASRPYSPQQVGLHCTSSVHARRGRAMQAQGSQGSAAAANSAPGATARGVRATGLGGPWEESAQRLSEYNTNQCNNSQCTTTSK